MGRCRGSGVRNNKLFKTLKCIVYDMLCVLWLDITETLKQCSMATCFARTDML